MEQAIQQAIAMLFGSGDAILNTPVDAIDALLTGNSDGMLQAIAQFVRSLG